MRRYLGLSLALLLVASLAFSVGFYSGFRKNVVFDAIVKTVRLLKPGEQPVAPREVHLDMTDRALLDSTLLPLHEREILITNPDGKPVPLLALAHTEGSEAVVLGDGGFLFRLSVTDCQDAGCAQQIGRLSRPDGTNLDDIYDILTVKTDAGREWYVSYGQEDADHVNKQLVISRFAIPDSPDAVIAVDEPFFRTRSFSLENGHAKRSAGGAMVFDPQDGSIIVTVGDFSMNGVSNTFHGEAPPPQSLDSDLGKILRVNRETGEYSMISMGHRNPQGLSLSNSGELISTEHGPKGGDEINLIEQGNNYGWPYYSMGAVYGTYQFPYEPIDPNDKIHGGFAAPIQSFLPSPGLSALIHVENFHPAWDGDLLVSTLKARSLFRLRRWPTGSYVEQLYIGDRIRDLEIIEGTLVLATDSGKIILLTPVEDLEMARTDTGLNTNLNALSECGACHNLNYPVSTNDAPHLRNILGRPIASAVDYENYSEALRARRDEVWTLESLEAFLRSPQDFAPGTAMPDLNLSDDTMAELLTLLPVLR